MRPIWAVLSPGIDSCQLDGRTGGKRLRKGWPTNPDDRARKCACPAAEGWPWRELSGSRPAHLWRKGARLDWASARRAMLLSQERSRALLCILSEVGIWLAREQIRKGKMRPWGSRTHGGGFISRTEKGPTAFRVIIASPSVCANSSQSTSGHVSNVALLGPLYLDGAFHWAKVPILTTASGVPVRWSTRPRRGPKSSTGNQRPLPYTGRPCGSPRSKKLRNYIEPAKLFRARNAKSILAAREVGASGFPAVVSEMSATYPKMRRRRQPAYVEMSMRLFPPGVFAQATKRQSADGECTIPRHRGNPIHAKAPQSRKPRSIGPAADVSSGRVRAGAGHD